jgi:hypothetical protein
MLLFRTKLFETILAMTVSERDRIPDFILSPAFLIKSKKILDLYTLLRTEIEKYERGEPCIETEEGIYELWSPTKEWNQQTFDSLESRLLNIIKKAIIYQNAGIDKLKSDITKEEEQSIEIKQLLYLAQFYQERKLHQQFENTINRLKILHNSFPLSNDHYYTNYLTVYEEYNVASLYRTPERNTKTIEVLENFDLYYLVNKLSLLIQFEPSFRGKVEYHLEQLENLSSHQNPLFRRIIDLYRMAFSLIWHKEGEDESILEKYLDVLEDDIHLLPLEQQKNLYTYARNFCGLKYKKGKRHYLNILFRLFKKNLKAGLLYHKDGTIPDGILHTSVQTIVTIALKLEQFDWALNFLNDHKTKIIAATPAEQQRFYHFNMACYHFQLKEYDEALFLLKMDFDDERYRLVARVLEIKLLFERNNKTEKEIEFLGNRIAAFETYLSRNYMSELDKAGYRNFLKFVKRLNKKKRITFSDLVAQTTIAEREWLLEKVHQMNELYNG